MPDKCACHVRGDFEIVYCSLHGAAPELLEALRASAAFAHGRGSYHAGSFDYCTKRECIAAREAIRKAENASLKEQTQ